MAEQACPGRMGSGQTVKYSARQIVRANSVAEAWQIDFPAGESDLNV